MLPPDGPPSAAFNATTNAVATADSVALVVDVAMALGANESEARNDATDMVNFEAQLASVS